MKFVVAGGAGIQALGTIYELCEHPEVTEVVAADIDLPGAQARVGKVGSGKVRAAYMDIRDREASLELLKGCQVFVNEAPAPLVLQATRLALEAGVDYVDLGAWPQDTDAQLALHPAFQRIGKTAVCGMGSAPGLSNVMARAAADRMDTVTDIHIIIAMRDYTRHTVPMVWPYMVDTILDELTEPALVFENGEFKHVPPLTVRGSYSLEEPIGLARPMYTIHPEPLTLARTYAGRGLRNATFSIALPAEFLERAILLVRLGFAGRQPVAVGEQRVVPRDLTIKLMNDLPGETAEPEQYSMTRVVVRGTEKELRVEYDVEVYVGSHKRWGIPAGALKTCVPPAIVALMLARGEVAEKGVLPPEGCVEPLPFFRHLSQRGMEVYLRRKEFAYG